jgi:adenylyltransferase/sulfurtransferase
MAGSLLIYDALEVTFRKLKLARDASCPLCGEKPTIRDLSHHMAPAEN